MIVVVADVAEEEGIFRNIGKLAGFFERRGALGRPPRIEVTALTAAETRTTPTAVHTLSGFVVEALGVDGQPL